MLSWLYIGPSRPPLQRASRGSRPVTIRSRPVSSMYMDKLDGRVRQELFDRQAASMRKEQEALVHKVQGIGKATCPRRSSSRHAPPDESSERTIPPTACKRASLSIAPEGCGKGVVEGRHTAEALFEPFEILRHWNQENNRKEKENGGSGRDLGIWLPTLDDFSPLATDGADPVNPNVVHGAPLSHRP